ncbi:MAG: hypothetical protein KAU14_07545, partial [Thermoplasmata archaeon]|nr:hypothetical protein [Thermoplasmata archaeon]
MSVRKVFAVIVLITLLASAPLMVSGKEGAKDIQETGVGNPAEVQRSLSSMKGWFTENQGQIENPEVRFVYAASDCSIGFVESGYLMKMTDEDNLTSVVRVNFEDSNPVAPVGEEELPHRSNFFLGNDSSMWRTNVANYRKVVYEGLYDGIDLVFYTEEKGLKYDFIVSPGADPKEIRYSYEGIDAIHIDSRGNLHLATPAGELVEEAPLSYQVKDGKMVEVSCQYWTEGRLVGFKIGNYDPSTKLVIDPLIYSTFVGGSGEDKGRSVALDSEGCAVVTGVTHSSDFPTTAGCYDDSYNGSGDAFVFKLSSNGSGLVYSTFVGGGDDEQGLGIALDSEGCTVVTGETESSDFPTTTGCYDDSYNGNQEVFAFKLNSDGSSLVYSTFVGGGNYDCAYGIALDSHGCAVVTGITWSSDFPTTEGCYDDSYNGNNDVFVFKLSSDGSSLVYSTYVGGGDYDYGYGIALDSQGCAVGTGFTRSSDFPTTPGCYDNSHNGQSDAFVFKLSSD